MSLRRLFEEQPFNTIFGEMTEFSALLLSDYLNRLERESTLSKGKKEIFDAVWGNVEFSYGEVCILDTPLLQRLRKIKQLGLAYFVYCGCDYSRFYHTIGVTHLADKMAEAINRCDLGTDDDEKEYFKAIVRLAAIFHDVGHMFLSHVSEHYFGKNASYKRHEEVECMLDTFESKAGKKAALHEILGCMIVNTESVHKLLTKVVKDIDGLADKEDYVDDIVEYVSALIVGVPVDRRILPYSNIINGPIDADKCDYLSRDSHVTRVPVAVDISRIIQKLSVVENKNICTSELWHMDDDAGLKNYELAMQDSAEKALFQLCIARTIMFDSVYYHHKVLTAETEFRTLIGKISKLSENCFSSFKDILLHTDDDFNCYFFENLRREKKPEQIEEINAIEREFNKLYERHFPKRVICLHPDFLEGAQKDTEKFWDAVMTTMESEEERTFISLVKNEYCKLEKLIMHTEVDSNSVNIFAIQAPTLVLGHSKIEVPIDLRNGNKREFQGYHLVNSRETSSSSSYIVTDEEDKMLVLMALEKVIYRKYHFTLKEEAYTCGKYVTRELNACRTKLFQEGYYDDAPILITNNLLFNYVNEKELDDIVYKYIGYEGVNGYKVHKDTLILFLKQIMGMCEDKKQCKDLLTGICSVLKKATFLDRKCITAGLLDKLCKMLDGRKEVHVVPLGALLDSAKHMMYYWNDIQNDDIQISVEEDLETVLGDNSVESIVLFDDGSFSGTQLISIMQEYMGIVDKKTKEHHVDELSEKAKRELRKKQITFFFVVFNQSREADIKEELKRLGLCNVRFEYVQDLKYKVFDESSEYFSTDKQRIVVEDFLRKVGHSIIESKKLINGKYKEGWDAQRVQDAALGYNDSQQMVILKSSVPTYTITAFWEEGKYREMQWIPFFKRTQKR